jgi:hypothetical protein
MEKADCKECRFKRTIHIDSSTCCVNRAAKAKPKPGSENNGFHLWPFSFDPRSILSCTGFVLRFQN